MTDIADDVKRVALEMIERFGAAAVGFAREQAEIAEGLLDISSAETWRDIADAATLLLRRSNYTV
jgi:hypothetical protein